jgi:outer membrane protein, multidrug efflux system
MSAARILWVMPWLLAACAFGPPKEIVVQPRSIAPVNLSRDAVTSLPDSAWPAGNWWRSYGDATLDTLIERAIKGAPQLASAQARFTAARENVRVAGAAAGVQVNASAEFEWHRLSDNGLLPTKLLGFNSVSQSDLGLSINYHFDWWGQQHAAIEGAIDQARASEAESRAATLALAAAVAETYFDWQADSARLALAQESLAALDQTAHIVDLRVNAGLDTAEQTQRLQQQRSASREIIVQLRAAQQLRRVTLAALLGVGAEEVPDLTPRDLPEVQGALPGNLGIDLLAQRPDIAASRWRVEAARQNLKGIRAEYYPDVSIHALIGLSSIEIGKLLDPGSRVPAVGAAIHLPLFDAGLRNARHGAAQAQLVAAVSTYDESVVTAAREVGAAATAMVQAQAQRIERQQQQIAAAGLLQIATSRERSGTTDLRPVLDARVALLHEQDSLLQIRQAALSADIQLKHALGGGAITGTTP